MNTFSGLFADYLGEGLASVRPTAPNLPPGVLGIYYATDAKALNLWNGSSWDMTTLQTAARLQAQWVSGGVVANDTVFLGFDMPYAGTINSLKYFTGSGSFTVAIAINGTPVTGLGAVTVNSPTSANVAASGANTFAIGDNITAVITSATSSPTDALLSLNITKL